jgi:hypothetical protein
MGDMTLQPSVSDLAKADPFFTPVVHPFWNLGVCDDGAEAERRGDILKLQERYRSRGHSDS